MSHSRTTMYRSMWLVMLTAFAVACSAPGGSGGGKAEVTVDGAPAKWRIELGEGENPGDAQYRRHGVATGISIRARSERGDVELEGRFIGKASDRRFDHLAVSYHGVDGETYSRLVDLIPEDGDKERVTWEVLDFDHDAGTGHVRVSFNAAACFDDYFDDLEYETRCHEIEGRFDTPVVRNPNLNIFF